MYDLNVASSTISVREAIQLLDTNAEKFLCIIDENQTLLGLFTQGDMRKYLLNSANLSAPVSEAMNTNPITFSSVEKAIEYLTYNNPLIVCPIVDEHQRLIDCYISGRTFVKTNDKSLENIPLVIMAGGKGTRLYPYTKILPKALIPIGDLTISERIIQQFTKWGCKDVYLILNHKASMIRAYYEELYKDYNVHYIEEKKFMGTGGGLSLLKEKIKSTFILSNCDILVDADYECIVKTHLEQQNVITFVAAAKNVVIPYGIISTTPEGQVLKIEEKPELSFLTNTGLYVIDSRVVAELNDDEFIHITDVAQRYMNKGEKIGVFPVSNKSWLDMGQFNEMETMIKELGLADKV